MDIKMNEKKDDGDKDEQKKGDGNNNERKRRLWR
jgi:hypothetical protein